MTKAQTPSTIHVDEVQRKTTSNYPPPYNEQVKGRARAALGNIFGLDQFGVNVVTLAPGAWSSHRHWHENEDEFIYVLDGELTLADDAGDHLLKPGMCAGFKAGNGNGHHLKNTSNAPASYLEVGSRMQQERAHYSEVDMLATKTDGVFSFTRKNGENL